MIVFNFTLSIFFTGREMRGEIEVHRSSSIFVLNSILHRHRTLNLPLTIRKGVRSLRVLSNPYHCFEKPFADTLPFLGPHNRFYQNNSLMHLSPLPTFLTIGAHYNPYNPHKCGANPLIVRKVNRSTVEDKSCKYEGVLCSYDNIMWGCLDAASMAHMKSIVSKCEKEENSELFGRRRTGSRFKVGPWQPRLEAKYREVHSILFLLLILIKYWKVCINGPIHCPFTKRDITQDGYSGWHMIKPSFLHNRSFQIPPIRTPEKANLLRFTSSCMIVLQSISLSLVRLMYHINTCHKGKWSGTPSPSFESLILG